MMFMRVPNNRVRKMLINELLGRIMLGARNINALGEMLKTEDIVPLFKYKEVLDATPYNVTGQISYEAYCHSQLALILMLLADGKVEFEKQVVKPLTSLL